jgi:aspartyl-tRNA(Asn)/glutamyl-tRNA(Gln) amidotransferase subunit A
VPPFNLDHYCHEGPMARTVADCALLENIIAGPHKSDVASIRPKLEIPWALPSVAGMRIALSPDLGCYNVDADVQVNTLAAADRLRHAGATVTEVSLPWDLESIRRAVSIHFGLIFGASMADLDRQFGDQLTSYARRMVADSAKVAKDELLAGLTLEAEIYAPLGELLDTYDALICPTMAVAALDAEYDTGDPLQVNGQPVGEWQDVLMTVPFNISSRCPVLSVPSGLSPRTGVPTGLAIVTKTYDDVTAFRVAAAHEERLPWLTATGPRPAL